MRTKKAASFTLALLMVLSMTACSWGNAREAEPNPSPEPAASEPTTAPTPAASPAPEPSETPVAEPEPKTIVAENDAFRVFAPAPDSKVGSSFTVSGEARVFEAAFSYSFEDGHNILTEGHATTSAGAPEWGTFEFDISIERASNPVGILTLYVASAKDGTPEHVLTIPVTFDESVEISLPGEEAEQ